MIITGLLFLLATADVTTVLIFVVVALTTWTYYKNRNLPPGPYGLPLVGYLPFMGRVPQVAFNELSKKYGQIMSLQFGPYLMVVLNDFETTKEAYVKYGDVFSGRPDGLLLKIKEDDKGVFISEGENWRDHRRFALSTFRDYGMGKNSIEPRITEEIHYFLSELVEKKGVPYDFHILLGMSTANIISTMEFGKRFEYTDPKFVHLRKLLDKILEIFGAFPIRGFYPNIAKIPVLERWTNEKKIIKLNDEIMEFMRDMAKEHEDNYVDGSKMDYIDAYFTERQSIINKTGNEGWFDHEELVGTLQGLFFAGTETTTTTIRWAILALLIYPEMQDKIQKEIDEAIGLDRAPTMGDKSKMPYTDAFLMEVQRFGSITPLSVFHSNIQETELYGYRIPKKTIIVNNQWAVHFDPKLWNNPELFNPERFINAKGQAEKPEYLIPFGLGKRLCLGEPLARMELFLYFTGMLQKFTFKAPPGSTPSFNDVDETIFRRPKPFKVIATEREGYQVTF